MYVEEKYIDVIRYCVLIFLWRLYCKFFNGVFWNVFQSNIFAVWNFSIAKQLFAFQ